MRRLHPLSDPAPLRKRLEAEPLSGADFLHRAIYTRAKVDLYATRDMRTALAVQRRHRHLVFWGDWSDVGMPWDKVPEKEFFVSSSPPEAIAKLKGVRAAVGEWPCWHFLAPPGYGPGPWDAIGPIRPDEVPGIARHWTLSDDPEPEMMRRVKKYDSACIRVRGRPVSWCGLHYEIRGIGNMGFAHTLERHRRKGYAQMVTKALVNRLAERGARATVHVIKDNSASIALCRSLGFETIGELTWAAFGRMTEPCGK